MTTPRTHARTRRAALAVASVGLLALTGCDPRTLFYFLQPFEPTVAAPGPSLKGKKVVIAAHAVASATGEVQALDRTLAREVTSTLRSEVKKVDIVDPDKVAAWVDDHPSWTDPAELAKAFEADVVIFLEVEVCQLQSPGDLNVFQGTSKTHIQVTEMAYPTNSKGKPVTDQPKEAKTIYDEYQDTEFPRRGPIPMDGGMSRNAFKSKFLKIVATEITWHFIDHQPGDDIQDVR